MNAPSKNVLVIAYAFPPVGGAGVQRTLKFVKYLKDFGWNPIVLTVSNPSVPVRDTDLLAEVPSHVPIFRARTCEPPYAVKGWLARKNSITNSQPGSTLKRRSWRGWIKEKVGDWLVPDPQVLWNPMAMRKALKISKQLDVHAIYVTGPPFSSFILGCHLKQKLGIPLVLDFRDEWSLSARYLENQGQGFDSGSPQLSYFHMALKSADGIIATTRRSSDELQTSCDHVGSKAAVRTIYNGFDREDLGAIEGVARSDQRFRLVYAGTLWRLTNIQPIVEALELLFLRTPSLKDHFELVVIGRKTPEQDRLLDRLDSLQVAQQRLGYMPHLQSLGWSLTADAISLLLADEPGAERVVPGKLFECLALGRPLLSIAPQGETTEILQSKAGIESFHPSQVEEIASWIELRIIEKKDRIEQYAIDGLVRSQPNLDWCSRQTLTKQLADFLEKVTLCDC